MRVVRYSRTLKLPLIRLHTKLHAIQDVRVHTSTPGLSHEIVLRHVMRPDIREDTHNGPLFSPTLHSPLSQCLTFAFIQQLNARIGIFR